MTLLIDQVAKETAFRRWVLPECLHVPIAAVDEVAISKYIGKIDRILAVGSPNRALLVIVEAPTVLDPLLPIFKLPSSGVLHSPYQVWVHIGYSRYRSAYKKAYPDENIDDKVLSHALNRRSAALQGFKYVRITPVSRGSNSSSAFSEKWGITLHSTPQQMEANQKQNAHIEYADLTALMLMMNMKLGGGVMDVVNEGQKLIRASMLTE